MRKRGWSWDPGRNNVYRCLEEKGRTKEKSEKEESEGGGSISHDPWEPGSPHVLQGSCLLREIGHPLAIPYLCILHLPQLPSFPLPSKQAPVAPIKTQIPWFQILLSSYVAPPFYPLPPPNQDSQSFGHFGCPHCLIFLLTLSPLQANLHSLQVLLTKSPLASSLISCTLPSPVLLHLSAAFNTVYHSLVGTFFSFGLQNSIFSWFSC